MHTSALRYTLLSVLFSLLLTLSGCSLIGGIFKAGAWTGVIAVLIVIGVVVWLFGKLKGGNRA